MLYLVVAFLLVLLDQAVKLLVRSMLTLGEAVPFLPGLLNLTYVQNTGAAFSSMEGKTLLLGLFSAAVALVLLYALLKPLVRHPLGRWLVTLVLAGAVGNMLDRLFLGYVTDMFQTTFMHFAVFNVADIYVVLGVIALALYIAFLWDRLEPKKPSAEKQDGGAA